MLLLGAAGSGLARWAADTVGPAGEVVVTDVRLSGAAVRGRPGIRFVRSSPDAEPLFNEAPFDIVHTRLVLGCLRYGETAFRRQLTPATM
ncbi:hypothetical protein [Streptomyces yatensis]|uniref:Uncharacterized protein n=1 Tax=Streptomyces yatensis TaxID=155177 RepID=A0ABN2IX69_9ACTN|nr:hypothetical protein [Streptomyces yatensis]